METKLKKGDKVRIIPADTHEDYVKGFYGKELEIKKVYPGSNTLYGVKDVPNYARETDLELIQD